eukprot:TRINITY_DN3906_c0_g1_i1.p2 TRINITY_DN3906_c0_g1~~TRINITY_DN3906_c0_g1_i1.p2  ORF type:complete len:248 (-),score=49.73 TRINITY_DN3906_c0_g1_i1:130-873(-)
MIRRPPRSTQGVSSAASDVYKRQVSTQSTWGLKNISDKIAMESKKRSSSREPLPQGLERDRLQVDEKKESGPDDACMISQSKSLINGASAIPSKNILKYSSTEQYYNPFFAGQSSSAPGNSELEGQSSDNSHGSKKKMSEILQQKPLWPGVQIAEEVVPSASRPGSSTEQVWESIWISIHSVQWQERLNRQSLVVQNASALCFKQGIPKIGKSLKRFNLSILLFNVCLLYTSPSPRDLSTSRMPSSA